MEANADGEAGGQQNAGNDFGIEGNLNMGGLNMDSNSENDPADWENSDLSDKEFFNDVKKVVMKSLKRKIRRQTCRQDKKKRARIGVKPANQDLQLCVPRASSRCNVGYLFEVIKSFSGCEEKKQLIRDAGFGSLLFFDGCLVPRFFAQYIADNTSVEGEYILIHSKQIILSAAAVHEVLGIPIGKYAIPLDDLNGKSEFLALFGQTEMPTIKFFGDLILSGSVDGDQFVRCFLVVALATFLCPTSSTKPSTKYLGSLIDIKKIKDLQFCNLVHDWLLAYIGKYQKDKMKVLRLSSTLGGCIYQLAVRCLDNLDFGTLELPRTLPRIYVWKGDLIKDFSKMDLQENGKYGARKVKDQAHASFIEGPVLDNMKPQTTARAYLNIREIIEPLQLNQTVKDNIVSSFEAFMLGESHSFHVKAQNLVSDVLRIVLSDMSTSLKTEAASKAENEEFFEKAQSESEKTLKVNSEEDDGGGDDITDATSRGRPKDMILDNLVFQEETITGADNHEVKGTEGLHISRNLDDALCERENSASFAHMVPQNEVTKHELQNEGNSIHCAEIKSSGSAVGAQVSIQEPNPADLTSKPIFSLAMKADFLNSSTKDTGRQSSTERGKKKYVFYDKSMPSFRLADFMDDDGTYIEEPELRRPLGHEFQDDVPMEDLKNMNASLRKQGMSDHNTRPGTEFCASQPKQKDIISSGHHISSSKHEYESELHIQCAQKPRSYSDYYSPNTLSPIKPTNLFHNLPESPDVLFVRETRYQMDYSDNFQDLELSPEVVCLGERKFNESCIVLGNKTNEHYNAEPHESRYVTGSSSSSPGKENANPKRFCQPSKYMFSPYDTGSNKPPTRGEVRYYEAMVRLASDEENKHHLAFNIDNVRVSHQIFGNSMKKGGWVEANIINAFCRQLFRENHPNRSRRHCFFHCSSEYFLQKYHNEGRKKYMKELVLHSFDGAGSAKPLHLTDLLCFPSLWQSHWFLFAVDVMDEKFIFLDSLLSAHSDYHRQIGKMMITNFVEVWNESGAKEQPFSDFHIVYPKVPTQGNIDDCGIYVMKFMELWSPRNQQACVFPRSDVPNFRVKLANRLMFSKYNLEAKSKMLVMTSSDAVQHRQRQA